MLVRKHPLSIDTLALATHERMTPILDGLVGSIVTSLLVLPALVWRYRRIEGPTAR